MRTIKKLKGRKFGPKLCVPLVGVMMLSTSAAFAADITEEQSYMSNADFESRWSGNYAGLHLAATGAFAVTDRGSGKGDLGIGEGRLGAGAYIGFNRQINNSGFLWGAELGISTLSADFSKSDATLGTSKLEANGLAEARLRLGYGWDKLHLYTTAGLAVSDIQAFGDNRNDNEYRLGIAYGAGMELALSQTWSARVEAIAYDFGTSKTRYDGFKRDTDLGAATVRIGLTKKF